MKFFVREIPYDKQNCSGIYKITNTINGKIYIGKTINFRKRYSSYKSGFKRQDVRAINEYFLNSINKYGVENFVFSIQELCDNEVISERELYWMEKFDSNYKPQYIYKGCIVRRIGYMHDEVEYECDPEVADEVSKMIELAIKKAGEHLKLNVPLAGEGKVGLNWKETH